MQKFTLSVTFLIFFLFIANFYTKSQDTERHTTGIQILNAKLGKDVKDRMLVDEDSTFELNTKVFLWMKVSGEANSTIQIHWKPPPVSEQSVVQPIVTELKIGGNPWRTWAYRTAYKVGEWTVTITDNEGQVIKELNYHVR